MLTTYLKALATGLKLYILKEKFDVWRKNKTIDDKLQ